MQEGIIFRLAERSDVYEFARLINAQYARKKTPAYFLWQYFDSCYPTVMMCAYQRDMLIGTFGLQRRMLQNGAIIGQAIDLLVVPQWRGKGIFKELGERAVEFFQELNALCVLPNVNGKIAMEKSLGLKTVGKINSMGKNVSDADEYRQPRKSEGPTVYSREDFMRFAYSVMIRQWRFEKNPIYKYDYVKLDSASFATTKLFEDPMTHKRYGDIIDFECSLYDPDKLTDLFGVACMHLQQQHVETVTTWALPQTPLSNIIKSLGFIEIQQERYFCVKVLKPEYDYLYDFSRWHLVQADAEVY